MMEKDLQLNMDAYLPLRDVVFQTLRSAILRGDLKPGERLMELQLASKLGVSRTPIREAIRMLEQEGLAITIPRRGAEVAKMTEKDMGDTLQIRRALEELAVVLVCDKITEEDVVELSEPPFSRISFASSESTLSSSDSYQLPVTEEERTARTLNV